MNTKAIHPEKMIDQTANKNPVNRVAIITVALVLAAVTAIAVNMANRPVVVTDNHPVLPYGNSLEMQYAQPWLNAQNKSVPGYSNALEMQYAQPWLATQNKPVAVYGNALELQYAQPWLQGAKRPIAVTGSETSLDCLSSIETLYACKYGYGQP